jgi:hypothetical protein
MSVFSGNLLYLYGGSGYYGFFSDLWSFNLVIQAWTLIKLFPIDYLCYGCGNINFEYLKTEYFTIFGGETWSDYSNDMYL